MPILSSMASRSAIIYLGHINSLSKSKIINQTITALKNLSLLRFKSHQLNMVDGFGLNRVIKEIILL